MKRYLFAYMPFDALKWQNYEELMFMNLNVSFSSGSTALFILKLVLVDMETAAPDYTTSQHSAR